MRFGIREKIALFAAVCLAVSALWYVFLYKPEINEVKRLKVDIRSHAEKAKRLSDEAIQAAIIEKNNEAVVQKFNEVMTGIPSKKRLSAAMDRLSASARGHRLQPIFVAPVMSGLVKKEEGPGTSLLEKIQTRLVLEGDYTDIGGYLVELSRLSFFDGYTNIHITSDERIYPETKAEIICSILVTPIEAGEIQVSQRIKDPDAAAGTELVQPAGGKTR